MRQLTLICDNLNLGVNALNSELNKHLPSSVTNGAFFWDVVRSIDESGWIAYAACIDEPGHFAIGSFSDRKSAEEWLRLNQIEIRNACSESSLNNKLNK